MRPRHCKSSYAFRRRMRLAAFRQHARRTVSQSKTNHLRRPTSNRNLGDRGSIGTEQISHHAPTLLLTVKSLLVAGRGWVMTLFFFPTTDRWKRTWISPLLTFLRCFRKAKQFQSSDVREASRTPESEIRQNSEASTLLTKPPYDPTTSSSSASRFVWCDTYYCQVRM